MHIPTTTYILHTESKQKYLPKKLVSKYLREKEIKYKNLVEIHFFKVGLSIQYHLQIAMYQSKMNKKENTRYYGGGT